MQSVDSRRPGAPRRRSLLHIPRTLQVNILLAFAALLIVTVLIIVGYTYRQNSKSILQLSDDLINQVNDAVIEKTNNYLAPAALMAQSSAQVPGAAGFDLVENEQLEAYGMSVLNLYPQLAGFFIGDEQGEFIFTKRFPDGSIGTQIIDRSQEPAVRTWTYRDLDGAVTEVEVTTDFDYDPRQRPWYEGARQTGSQYWTDIYIFFTDQKPGITAAYPIKNESGDLVSVIGIDVALDELSRFLETQRVGQNGVVFIANSKGEVVAFPGAGLAMQEGDAFRPLSVAELEPEWVGAAYQDYRSGDESRLILEHEDVRYIADFTPFPESFGKDWLIGIVVPEDDFIGSIKQTNQVSLLISLFILIVAIVSAIFISRTISRPIVLLTDETNKIKNFDLDGRIEVYSPIREVQQLGESIAAMKSGLQAFKKYVPAALVRRLIESGEEARLGGDKRELTIFFTDIAGFTTLSEGMEPEELMLQLSEYLGELARIVMDMEGTVDKYMGDGLMAFWGAPVPHPEHAVLACRAALQCRDRVNQLNEVWQAAGKPIFPTRIGIHTGETLVGNMGSQERMNYTVLGDSVNLASRLEVANAIYGTDIIVGAGTYQQTEKTFYYRPLDLVTVKGKRWPVLLYELVGERGSTTQALVDLCENFANGFELYLAREWAEAQTIFESLGQDFPGDAATQIYLTRCIALQQEPPGDDWQPIAHLSGMQRTSLNS